MTERKKSLSFETCILIAAVLFIACPTGIPKGTAYIYVRFMLPGNLTNASAKKPGSMIIGPESGWNIASYRLTFTEDNGEVITKTIDKAGGELSIKAGNWILLAEGLTADGAVIVQKETQVLAQAGKRISIQIMLHLAQGKGSLQLAFSPNQSLPPDWRYFISLEYRGLPGDPTFQGPALLSTDIPATQMDYQVNELESGNYSLSVQVRDTSSASIAGCIATVLILPEQTSIGSCSISLPNPSATISLSTPKLELSANAAIAIERYLNRNRSVLVPFAIAEGQTNLDVEWYQNGVKIEKAQEEATQCLPGHRVFLAPSEESDAQMSISMDALLSDRNSGISQAFSNSSSLLAGPLSDQIEWVQSIDYKAALSPSLHNRNNPENAGTGNLQMAKWVAASPSGLIAVAGLDESNALHLFYSPSGKQAALGGSGYEIPSSVGWIRLWRDKISIGKDKKNPDIVSISLDGSLIAAAASTGKWIRLYRLDNSGSIASKIDIVSGLDEAPEFGDIRAMRFTADSARLFILANSPTKVLVFNTEKLFNGEHLCEKESSFAELFSNSPSPSISMQDMMLLDDDWIAACSSKKAIVFFVKYSSINNSFASGTMFESGPNSESLGEPRSIAFDDSNDRCYVISHNRKLHLFEKLDPLSPYALSMTFSLSADLNDVKWLALVKKSSGGTYLVTGGNNGLGIISLDANGHPITQSSLNSQEANPSGIISVNNVAVLGESIILTGYKSGIVAMFDILGL